MRKILIGLGILLVILLSIGVYLVTNIDSIVKSRIERTGSRIAGVPVSVGAVNISLSKGTATLTDLTVANAPGFSDKPSMNFAEISVSIDVTSGVIRRVYSSQPTILVEGPALSTNIDVLRKNVIAATSDSNTNNGQDDMSGQSDGEDGKDEAKTDSRSPDAEEKEPSMIFTIDLIEIEQAGVGLQLEELDKPLQLTLDQLQLNNLSGTRSEITRQILDQLTDKILTAVHEQLKDVAKETIRSELKKQVKELDSKALKELKGLFNLETAVEQGSE